MNSLLDPPPVRTQHDPAQRLRTTMAAMRLSFTWFGIRKALSSEQKASAADAFGAEADCLSAGKKLIDTRDPTFRAVTLIRSQAVNSTGYVDLQSPAGIGISCLVFNYDGGIYASDEARMLAEMGDQTFRLGHLLKNSYEEVMLSPVLIETLEQTMTEGMPMCSDCGFQPYCGSDPVHHYATQGDVVGFKPTSSFCGKNMGVLRHVFQLLEDDPRAADILSSWIQ